MKVKGGNAMDFLLPSPVAGAIRRLREAGFASYVVGGCVRDWVLGIPPHDFDICTAASPDEMKKVFRQERTIETGIQHGTLTVLWDHEPLEITTFRLDGEYLDGRHPSSVRFTRRIEEDLSRRDFTINAMAYAPDEGMIDPFGGQADCQRGLIRCVGEPERRFSEDALRILRALRFSARLGFPVEEKTTLAIRKLQGNLQKISRERIAAELTGLLQGEYAEKILQEYRDVIVSVVPALEKSSAARWSKAAASLSMLPRDPMFRWTALLGACRETAAECSEVARQALQELKMPARLVEGAGILIAWRDVPLEKEYIREMMMNLGPERLSQLILWKKTENASVGDAAQKEMDRLIQENACYSLAQLAVKGKDMVALGLRGPQIGRALEQLLLMVVRQQLPNERETLLHFISTHVSCG